MNENILGSSTSYFVVGSRDNGAAFPVSINGFSAYRAGDIQYATLYQDSATVVKMANLLTMFAQLNSDTTVFAARQQLIEYSEVETAE